MWLRCFERNVTSSIEGSRNEIETRVERRITSHERQERPLQFHFATESERYIHRTLFLLAFFTFSSNALVKCFRQPHRRFHFSRQRYSKRRREWHFYSVCSARLRSVWATVPTAPSLGRGQPPCCPRSNGRIAGGGRSDHIENTWMNSVKFCRVL